MVYSMRLTHPTVHRIASCAKRLEDLRHSTSSLEQNDDP